MTFVLDTDVLGDTARHLLRHDLALRAEPRPDPPDTGETTAETLEGLDALAALIGRVVEETHALADALQAFLERAVTTDDEIAGLFGALLSGTPG